MQADYAHQNYKNAIAGIKGYCLKYGIIFRKLCVIYFAVFFAYIITNIYIIKFYYNLLIYDLIIYLFWRTNPSDSRTDTKWMYFHRSWYPLPAPPWILQWMCGLRFACRSLSLWIWGNWLMILEYSFYYLLYY